MLQFSGRMPVLCAGCWEESQGNEVYIRKNKIVELSQGVAVKCEEKTPGQLEARTLSGKQFILLRAVQYGSI